MDNTLYKGKTEEEIWDIAEPFADRILAAIGRRDFDAFSTDFSGRMKSLVTEESFIETSDRFERDYGLYQKRRRVCVLANPDCAPVIWAINFDKSPLDILFQVRIVVEDGKLLTDSALFRTWLV